MKILTEREWRLLSQDEKMRYLVDLCKENGCGDIGEYLFGSEDIPKEVCNTVVECSEQWLKQTQTSK